MWSDEDDSFEDREFICSPKATLRSGDDNTNSGEEIGLNRLSVENGECAAAEDIHTRLLMDSKEAKKNEKCAELMLKVSRKVISNRVDDARFRSGDTAEIEKSWEETPPPSLNGSDDDNTDSGKEIGPHPLSVEYGQCAAPEDLRMRLLMEIEKAKNRPKHDQWIPKVPRTVASSGTESRNFRCGHAIVAEVRKSWEESPQTKKCYAEVGRQRSTVDAHQKANRAKVKTSGDSKKRVTFERDKDIGRSEQKKVSPNEMESHCDNLDSSSTLVSARFL
ncbi:unnamed protein product [Angiostrongylus costaricensis]|uniref:Remorin_C domain-containing protein n=1 Tax=Angiostrongylus costaricensis TaxID=334426 RepID=A0A0R3PHA4_ANGCS|nr:unnamed protein product [Angiostrongylus costaricensis]